MIDRLMLETIKKNIAPCKHCLSKNNCKKPQTCNAWKLFIEETKNKEKSSMKY